MDAIERLAALFEKFPGIGPRQAQRFVQFLLKSSASTRSELIEAVRELGASMRQCSSCMRYYSGKSDPCPICAEKERDASLLTVVASDADLSALERNGTYRGYYFVLGGTISLASEKADRLRIKELLATLPSRIKKGLQEVILAFPANPEGDATAARVREELVPSKLAVTSLGRGLSTGSELEYADPETLKSAFESRR